MRVWNSVLHFMTAVPIMQNAAAAKVTVLSCYGYASPNASTCSSALFHNDGCDKQ